MPDADRAVDDYDCWSEQASDIARTELAAFFQPYAELQHRSPERVHIHCSQPFELGHAENEWHHHCAGYVCEVTDASVTKYTGGFTMDAPILFGTINRVTIHDINGKQLREYRVVDRECAA